MAEISLLEELRGASKGKRCPGRSRLLLCQVHEVWFLLAFGCRFTNSHLRRASHVAMAGIERICLGLISNSYQHKLTQYLDSCAVHKTVYYGEYSAWSRHDLPERISASWYSSQSVILSWRGLSYLQASHRVCKGISTSPLEQGCFCLLLGESGVSA